jgi:hypothetical protein
LKNLIYLYFVSLFWLHGNAQIHELKVLSKNKYEQNVLDSLDFPKTISNTQSIIEIGNALLEKIQKLGYLEATYTNSSSNSIYHLEFELGNLTLFAHLYTKDCIALFKNSNYPITNDTISIPYTELSSLLEFGLKKLEASGESLSKLQLTQITKHPKYIAAKIEYLSTLRRKLNTLVLRGFDRFPKGHLKSLEKIYQKSPFNQALVKQLKKEFDSYPFCTQIKYPEIQFTKDSTSLYIYVQKRNANSFDGFMGFSNSESKKITLSGYVDVLFQNILNSGESIAITWKSDGKQQTTFDGQVELPYLFNSPLALKTQLNLFKQDSTFQNTKTALQLGYYFRFHKRLYLGYQSAESSDIQNTNSISLTDYKNYFTTASYEYLNQLNSDPLFSDKTKFKLVWGIGQRNTPIKKNKQYFISSFVKHDWRLNEKNHLIIKNEVYYLKSDSYLTNELNRFGGINSVVGFNENSLQANFYNLIRAEYRYQLSGALFWSILADFGVFQDQTISLKSTTLTGLGTGIKLATKTGLLNLFYASGSTQNQSFTTNNALIHLSLKSYF